MIGTWYWQRAVHRRAGPSVVEEPWEHVQERFPLPSESVHIAELSGDLASVIVSANPFSPKRRQIPPPASQQAQGQGAELAPPPPPQFVYRGRIVLGTTERAVLEEAMTKKTYFLQAGQEVRGFKVLDMTEDRVVLSDTQTNEEVIVPMRVAVPSEKQGGARRQVGTP